MSDNARQGTSSNDATDSACNGLEVIVKNVATYVDGSGCPIQIAAAGPTTGGGTLNLNGQGTPITVAYGDSVTLYAYSADGTNGTCAGTLTLTLPYGTAESYTSQSITVTYSGVPSSSINSKGCNATSSQDTYTSANFTVTVTSQSGKGYTGADGNLWIKFTASSGTTTTDAASSSARQTD
jgi:hypothetical protein